ncbi:enoyl-CoA hydratase/isomerase family protein [Nocardioides montaniterrae]
MSAVTYAYADGVARITLAEPDRGNPIHPAGVDELLAAAQRAQADGARVIVLSADGRFFSVGGDLGAFSQAEDVAGFIDGLAEQLHRAISELVRADAIVVTVVQGTAAGAGFPLACVGDIVVAADTAKFSLAYTKVGLSPDGGSSLLVHSLGLHRMLRYAILGDLATAQELYDAGLVARVVPAAELTATVDGIVASLVEGSAPALAAAKRLIRTAAETSPESVMRRETLSIRALAAGPDGREGVAAFVAKRAPQFG